MPSSTFAAYALRFCKRLQHFVELDCFLFLFFVFVRRAFSLSLCFTFIARTTQLLSYVPFEVVTKLYFSFCVGLFVFDPFQGSRFVSFVGCLILLLIVKLKKSYETETPGEVKLSEKSA